MTSLLQTIIELDRKDRILQNGCPTIMVPVYSSLPDLAIRHRRFLMARDGLWLEARPPWGQYRYPLWKSPVPLPYGPVEELHELINGPIPPKLIQVCKESALDAALKKKEWAGWIVCDQTGGYSIKHLNSETTYTSVRYERPALNEGESLILDLHSHPFDMPAFSQTDNLDDLGGIHYSGVISFDHHMNPKLTIRFCIEGFYFV